MFTGLIEEIGEIKSIAKGAKSARITIKAEKVSMKEQRLVIALAPMEYVLP